jgi:CBS domain-containing protein
MQVQDIMTANPICVDRGTSLEAIAQMLVECDCGAVPVCEQDNTLVGIITDRDIVCRTLAKGLDALEMIAADALTPDPYTINQKANVDDCIRLMQQEQIRRVPVVDDKGKLIGIVSQADIVRRAVPQQPNITDEFEEALEEISQPKASV